MSGVKNSLIFSLLILPVILIFSWTLFFQGAQGQTRPDNPEAATPRAQLSDKRKQSKEIVDGPGAAMAVTADKRASRAAMDILEAGGNAVDAAIAAQLVLGLVEPQSSGLGGGAFVLYYDAKSQKLYSLDGRETAPLNAGSDLFLQDGKAMDFWSAVIGGRAVGTPGTPKLLDYLHDRFGRKSWESLFTPAINLAENGFIVSERLGRLISEHKEGLKRHPASAAYFLRQDMTAKPPGSVLKNPAYAKALELFRDQGDVTFYRGALAHEIVATIRRFKENPGKLSLNDLKSYKIKQRPNLCAPYRGFRICSMGEPSSGGLTLLQMLGLLERFDLGEGPNARALHLITEASRLAFSDRNFYMADPNYVLTPGALLLAPDYIARRSALINPSRRLSENLVTPGLPSGFPPVKRSPDQVIRPPGTTHISIRDRQGNVISMTSTIEQGFGSHMMTSGFLLNNELTDFSFVPQKQGWPVANRVEGGKRPRSSMAPTIVFTPEGKPFLIVGSAGGSRIIGYLLKTLIHVIDWNTPVGEALAAPHFLSRGQGLEMERGLESLHKDLERYGHMIKVGTMNSGLTAIHFAPQKTGDKVLITGAADPRREGVPVTRKADNKQEEVTRDE